MTALPALPALTALPVGIPHAAARAAEAPAAAATSEDGIAVAYFSWYENVDAARIDRAAIDSEANHSREMDGPISEADAVSAASLAGARSRDAGRALDRRGDGRQARLHRRTKALSGELRGLLRARERAARHIRPALSDETLARLEVLRQAKTVFLVFPNWDYSLPVVVQRLLESVDWSGKRVLPACLHGTGGLSRTIRELHGAVRGAKGVTVGEPLSVYRLEINRSEARMKAWARKSPES